MRILDITKKDIRQILRDWKSALFLVVMPILFTTFFGLIFNPVFAANRNRDNRLPVGWINEDPGALLTPKLEELLGSSDVIRLIPLEGAQADRAGELVDEGELAAVLRIPAGYSSAIIADQPSSLQVIANQTTPAGRTSVNALDAITGRLLGAVESAHLAVENHPAGFPDGAARQKAFQSAFAAAIAAWKQPPLTVQVQAASRMASQDDPGRGDPGLKINGFTQSSAGMMVQFAIFGLINSAMMLVLERKTRALQRLLTTPVSRAEIISGHVLAMFVVVFAQETLLATLGQFLFGVDYLRQPLAVLLMIFVLALFSASLGLLIGALARKEDQVIVLCLLAMFLFSALGGAWFPLDVAGKAFSTVGHLMPSAWAMDGFQNIVLRGLDFSSVLMPAGVLMVYTLVFFGLALWRFKFE